MNKEETAFEALAVPMLFAVVHTIVRIALGMRGWSAEACWGIGVFTGLLAIYPLPRIRRRRRFLTWLWFCFCAGGFMAGFVYFFNVFLPISIAPSPPPFAPDAS